ncbi:MAG: NusG domain II-containing protein [Sphaerochaeta sp.]|jgi:hypothetical protein|nr:NusG domain II-containing protein [Sphaerochaeta sp.]MCI2129134.1 NusG domain II-containing protein [Sphaerochaeta sp.]
MAAKRWSVVREGDLVVIALALCLIIAISLRSLASSASGKKAYAKITNGENVWRYPLDSDRSIEIPGLQGITYLKIENGTIRATESPGDRRIIMKMGAVGRPGQWLLSIPNGVMVTIEGDAPPSDEMDDFTW